MNKFSEYIVFVDESGDHSLTSIDEQYPILVLCFLVINKKEYIQNLVPKVKQLKFDIFGHDSVILHERDIRRSTGDFYRLSKEEKNYLLTKLSDTISQTKFDIFAMVIDKKALKSKYKYPDNPYHLGFQFGLERIKRFLRHEQTDSKLHIIVESRGKAEDEDLKHNFDHVITLPELNSLKAQLIFLSKESNSEGLQIADLCARPIGLSVLRKGQPNQAYEILKDKIYTTPNGVQIGHGLKVFPS